MEIANKFDERYWDGERRHGYGGYKYIPDRWKPVAEKIIEKYKLNNNSSILDVGCGKGFLLFEIKKLLPKIKINGFDISEYGINNSPKEVREFLFMHDASTNYPYKNDEFDLVISINTLHNLKINQLKIALSELERVGKEKYIVVESYNNEEELFNLQCWALTCQSFFSEKEWIWIFEEFNYTGDYEFIYF
jgi:ubiquinone/menaquinone biosynthesis C-methylase UbiE